MKKLIFSSLLILSLGIAGCGGGGTASTGGDTNNKGNNEATEEKEDKSVNAEITKHTGGAWKNSIDTTWVHSAAIFENTGETPVKIGESQLNYKDKDGGVIGTSSMVYSVPSIVLPGEIAIISESTTLDGIDVDEYAETSYNFSFDKTSDDPNLMEVSGEKGTLGEYGYKITGLVTNPTDEQQDDIRLAAALYDEDGELLGALSGSIDVGVAAGSEAGFELNYPDVPPEVWDRIADFEVLSYGWNW